MKMKTAYILVIGNEEPLKFSVYLRILSGDNNDISFSSFAGAFRDE